MDGEGAGSCKERVKNYLRNKFVTYNIDKQTAFFKFRFQHLRIPVMITFKMLISLRRFKQRLKLGSTGVGNVEACKVVKIDLGTVLTSAVKTIPFESSFYRYLYYLFNCA